MSYSTGSVSSLNDLLTALITAATDEGWTLNGTDVLETPAGDGFFQLLIGAYSTYPFMSVRGGRGYDSGATYHMTEPGPASVRLRQACSGSALAFPATFHFHVFANEIYVLLNYAVDCFIYAAFGVSPFGDSPGVWCTATSGEENVSPSGWSLQSYNGSWLPFNLMQGEVGAGPFIVQFGNSSFRRSNGLVYHGLDGATWSSQSVDVNSGTTPILGNATACACWGKSYSIWAGPNRFNGEAVMGPIQPYIGRGASKVSIIANLNNARFLRIDNLAAGEVFTIGSDQWKAYPHYKKNSAFPQGQGNAQHSGCYGWAIRYEEP